MENDENTCVVDTQETECEEVNADASMKSNKKKIVLAAVAAAAIAAAVVCWLCGVFQKADPIIGTWMAIAACSNDKQDYPIAEDRLYFEFFDNHTCNLIDKHEGTVKIHRWKDGVYEKEEKKTVYQSGNPAELMFIVFDEDEDGGRSMFAVMQIGAILFEKQ